MTPIKLKKTEKESCASFGNMQKIEFQVLSKKLKKLVDEEGLGLYGSLSTKCWIEKIENKKISEESYCGEYYITYFPSGQKPVYSILPDWFNILLDEFERNSKKTIQNGIKKLLAL